MDQNEAQEAEREVLGDWDDFTRIGVTDALTARTGALAWQHDLCGYGAAQLAAALAWRVPVALTERQRRGWVVPTRRYTAQRTKRQIILVTHC